METGWGTTRDEGTITRIYDEKQSKNGPFFIFQMRDKATGDLKRIQAWGNAYWDLKNENFYVGSNVIVPGYVHYYKDEKTNTRQVRVKTQRIYPQGGTLNIKLLVTSDWYKGEMPDSTIQAFSGKPIYNGDRLTDSLVVRCYMSRYNPLWRLVKKGSTLNVTGIYKVDEDETGSRLVITDVLDIEEVKDGQKDIN